MPARLVDVTSYQTWFYTEPKLSFRGRALLELMYENSVRVSQKIGSVFITKTRLEKLFFWREASRCAYKRNIILISVRQHNYYVIQGNYIGNMFRLLISHLQAYFCQLSHKVLCTHWDPIVFTSMEYIKLNHLSQKVCHSLHFTPFETNDLISCIPCM